MQNLFEIINSCFDPFFVETNGNMYKTDDKKGENRAKIALHAFLIKTILHEDEPQVFGKSRTKKIK